MNKQYYAKAKRIDIRRIVRYLAFGMVLLGSISIAYTLFPLVSWQIYFAPVFAASDVALPIPKTTVVSASNMASLLEAAANPLAGVDYSNPQNWFPNLRIQALANTTSVSSYTLSIPSLKIDHALVSTTDMDLDAHLVNYAGTAVPPDKGTAVIFGHSTLPQLFDQKNYKTIFANAYRLKVGDTIDTQVGGVTYSYKIFSITIVDPSDTSVFAQSYDNPYLTLVTCTPPGTTWKRLIIRSRLEKI